MQSPNRSRKKMTRTGKNLEIHQWIDQKSLLAETHIMITHGGLGTLKECIEREVPVIAIPLIHDQTDNATRIEKHGIGKKLDANHFSEVKLLDTVKAIENDYEIPKKLKKMKEFFLRPRPLPIHDLLKNN